MNKLLSIFHMNEQSNDENCMNNNDDQVENGSVARRVAEWQSRIKNIQSKQLPPELLESITLKKERQKRAEKAVKSAKRLQKANFLSSSSCVAQLRNIENYCSKGEQCDEEVMNSASSRYKGRSCAIQQLAYTENLIEQDEDLIDEQLNVMELDISNELQHIPLAEGCTKESANDITHLLKQLEREPTEESEIRFKFQLFEDYLETVTALRNHTLKFWEDNKDQFTGPTLEACQKHISDIDSHDSLGIEENHTVWFVYSMTLKAQNNSSKIDRTLSILTTKLELLSVVDECPCCLDELKSDNHVTLRCCHKVCKECWENWSTLKGADVFCPLCNQNAFVQEVFTA